MIQFFNNISEQYKDKLRTPFFGTFVFWWFVFHVEAIYDLFFVHKLTKNIFVKAKKICVDKSFCNISFIDLNENQKELLLIDYKRLLFNSLFEFSLSNLLRIIFFTIFSLLMFYVFKAITYYIISFYSNKVKPRISEITYGKVVEEYKYKRLQSELKRLEIENDELKEDSINSNKLNLENINKISNLNDQKNELDQKIVALEEYKFEMNEENSKRLYFQFFLLIMKYFNIDFDYFFHYPDKNIISNEKYQNMDNFLKSFKNILPNYKKGSVDSTKEWVFGSNPSDYSNMIKEMNHFLEEKDGQIVFKYYEEFQRTYNSLKNLLKRKTDTDELPF